MSLKSLRKQIDEMRMQRRTAMERQETETAALAKAEKRLQACDDAITRVQALAEHVQSTAHQRVAQLATEALQAVFGDRAYAVEIQVDRKRRKTEARLVFTRGGKEIDPLSSSGGGMVDVAAFALRLAALCMSKPKRRRILILDEPFRFVSREYWSALSELLLMLAKRLQVQFIVVTHITELELGKVIRLG